MIFGQTLGCETESDGPQMKKTGPKIPVHNKRIALAVRDAARYASIRDQVLEEYVGNTPNDTRTCVAVEVARVGERRPTAPLN